MFCLTINVTKLKPDFQLNAYNISVFNETQNWWAFQAKVNHLFSFEYFQIYKIYHLPAYLHAEQLAIFYQQSSIENYL